MIHLIPQLIIALLPVVIHYTIVYIVYLTFLEIKRWFNSLSGLLSNKKYSAVSFKKTLESGKIAIVQGVLNMATSQLEKAREITYEKLDDQLTQLHDQNDLVIYT